ncbi:MAG: HAMP domain-containing histidine kinase [Lachnospiraceae bacterium]|nr:HAMP domain-containing histidine kinase [Lachnospiraceae bacterium]
MATKWKNMVNKIKNFFKRNRRLLLGLVSLIVCFPFFYSLIAYRWYHPTEEAWFFGIVGNVLLGIGIILVLGKMMQNKYRYWLPEDENYYSEWRMKFRKQQQVMGATGIVLGLLACWYMSYLTYSAQQWAYSYSNYASGYVLIITVIIQYGICQFVVVSFMGKKLNLLMERMAEINRQRLDEALEIEHQSIAKAMEIEKKSLEKVSRSDQLKVDLITNVSHDLKTPLTSMVGYIELMKKEELNDTVRDYVEVISAKAVKLKEMIESLFSLAKASSGNVELHKESLELNRLIEQIFADMDDRIKGSSLAYVMQLTEENTSMVTDNMHLYRICQNLIENTLKYSAKGTRVFIRTYVKTRETASGETEEKLCLEIVNTASYFMDFQKEDIVERFARADKARTSEGNGLGLAIVSTYTSALGGEFDIRIDCDQFKATLVFSRQIE